MLTLCQYKVNLEFEWYITYQYWKKQMTNTLFCFGKCCDARYKVGMALEDENRLKTYQKIAVTGYFRYLCSYFTWYSR